MPILTLMMSSLRTLAQWGLEARNWPLVAALVSLALLAGAFASEYIWGYLPCPMCITQRWAHAAIAGGGIAVFLALRLAPLPALSTTLGVGVVGGLSGVSLWHAGHHVLVEYQILDLPPSCAGAAPAGGVSLEQMEQLLGSARIIPLCNEISWSFLGLSMAGWNALVSAGLLAVSAYILFTRLTQPQGRQP